MEDLVQDMKDAFWDVVSIAVPVRLKPKSVIMREEKERSEESIRRFTRDIARFRLQEKQTTNRLISLSRERQRIIDEAHARMAETKTTFPSIEYTIAVESMDNDLLSAGKELCTLRILRNSAQDNLNRTRDFHSLLTRISGDEQLMRSIQNFNIGMGESAAILQENLHKITMAFETNTDAIQEFRENFKDSVADALKDDQSNKELTVISEIIGLNLQNPKQLGQIPPLPSHYLQSEHEPSSVT